MKTADQIAKALEMLPVLQKMAHASGSDDIFRQLLIIESSLEWVMCLNTRGVGYIDKLMEGGKMFDTRVN